eukprot:GHVS01007079.1.p1 GENE.GHVS01007079.1~~GHVS01007079.1.p1  ORF type:complete len:420 (+),score=101.17 GHVS01007079.1:75-1334(+)
MHRSAPQIIFSRPTLHPHTAQPHNRSPPPAGSLSMCCCSRSTVWLCSQWASSLPHEFPTIGYDEEEASNEMPGWQQEMAGATRSSSRGTTTTTTGREAALVALLLYDGHAFYSGSISRSSLSSQVQWKVGSVQRLMNSFTQTPSDETDKLLITDNKQNDATTTTKPAFWLSVSFSLSTSSDLNVAAVPSVPLHLASTAAISQIFTSAWKMQTRLKEAVSACKEECNRQSEELQESNKLLSTAVADRELLKTEMLSKFSVLLNSVQTKANDLRQQLAQQTGERLSGEGIATAAAETAAPSTPPPLTAAPVSSGRTRGRRTTPTAPPATITRGIIRRVGGGRKLRIVGGAAGVGDNKKDGKQRTASTDLEEPTDELMAMIRVKQEEETQQEQNEGPEEMVWGRGRLRSSSVELPKDKEQQL